MRAHLGSRAVSECMRVWVHGWCARLRAAEMGHRVDVSVHMTVNGSEAECVHVAELAIEDIIAIGRIFVFKYCGNRTCLVGQWRPGNGVRSCND